MNVECPLCHQPVDRSVPATIAPFLRVRCGLPEDVQGFSHLCGACEHVFFTPELTADQLQRLYTGYRGEEYNEMRFDIEPGYESYAIAFDDPNSEHDRIRNSFYDFALGDYKHFDRTVIDYGGGDGHFSRRIFSAATVKIVEEDFVRNGGDLISTLLGADLLFCAHVAEHLPDPVRVLSGVTRYLQPGTRVWVEVPMDYDGNLTAAFARAEAGEHSPLVVMHEHVAHFSRRSLKSLAARIGLGIDEIIVSDHRLLAAICHKI